ncbi:hypothetical protein CRG98_000711 [Punica granatum]|uniref:Uncharacterized protein n=1 Tax=Punica granatum TaxID=22663 RepID=A0A2I0LDV6_PUNGR|nr:hypothetical protein CRG98_000711 [Punica granatum]
MEYLQEVERLSGGDHLVTGGVRVVYDPSKDDGTTRLSRGTVDSSTPTGDRELETSYESTIGAFSVFLKCSAVFGDHCVLRFSKTSPKGLPGDV